MQRYEHQTETPVAASGQPLGRVALQRSRGGGLAQGVAMASPEYESWHRTGREVRPNDDMTIWQAVVEVGPMLTLATLAIAAGYYAVVTVLKATQWLSW
jgi:hypothetical protein